MRLHVLLGLVVVNIALSLWAILPATRPFLSGDQQAYLHDESSKLKLHQEEVERRLIEIENLLRDEPLRIRAEPIIGTGSQLAEVSSRLDRLETRILAGNVGERGLEIARLSRVHSATNMTEVDRNWELVRTGEESRRRWLLELVETLIATMGRPTSISDENWIYRTSQGGTLEFLVRDGLVLAVTAY